MDGVKEESIKRWNSLSKSEQLALMLYYIEIEDRAPNKGLQDFVNSFQDKACVFDVPDKFAER